MKENIPELKINGEKVFLRPPTEADFTEISEKSKASAEFHRNFTAPPQTREEFDRYLTKSSLETNACFLICSLADNKIVGAIELSQIFRGGFQNAYLGYYLFAAHTGRGYMTEAVELILRHAFKSLELHRVEANVQPENKPSIAVLERNGFIKEGFSEKYLKIGGEWRDHERWAITVENWRG
jgi:[ribosomal protein S5]-alanine N-acetyltransferase